MSTERLAVDGGTPVRIDPMPVSRRFGAEEREMLEGALAQNTLFYVGGHYVKDMVERFRAMYEVPFAAAVSSGTAAIHAAIGAAGIAPGDEIITAPITDMGGLIGILYQNAVPVFADLDPATYTLDPRSVEACITDRTRAVVAVHLTGNPCDMDALGALCRRRGLILIEDCAQSWGARYGGRPLGSIGDLGCFSLNDFKHISAGDGGIVCAREERFGKALPLWADKCYNRAGAVRDPVFLAPNYRMSELQGAVGLAQLGKVDSIVARRRLTGERLTAGLASLPGIHPPKVQPRGECSYWFYLLRIDERVLGPRARFVEALKAEGVPCKAGYIDRPIYRMPVFSNKAFFAGGIWPAEVLRGRTFDYPEGLCPVAEAIIRDCVLVVVGESYTDRETSDIVEAFRKITSAFSTRGGAGR